MKLENKVALITGGAAGIGRATAERFISEGATVVICDLNEDAGQETAAALGADFYHLDVSKSGQVRASVDAILARFKRIDILVNNAGILRDGQLIKWKDNQVQAAMTEQDFDLVIGVNLKGVFNCTKQVSPAMIKQGEGVILNASSVVGLDGNFGQTNYVASKAGVIGMTKVWSRELGRYGIRVNAVAPGLIYTEILQDMPAKILDGMKARTPLGRLGRPLDVANAYLFLASDEAAFITGATLRIDGGIVIGT